VNGRIEREGLAEYTRTPHSKRWMEGALILAFWICMFTLTTGQRATDPWGPPGLNPDEVLFTGVEYLVWLLLTPVIFWFSRRVSLERGVWSRHLPAHILVAFVVAVAVNAFNSTMLHELVIGEERPFSLVRSFKSLHFIDELVFYLTVLAAGLAREYFLRYQERQQEAMELRTQAAELQIEATHLHAQLVESRLQALRMQLNPHFLFNTLHTISTDLERDPRGVRRMISRLSGLLRYTLEMTDTKEVPLRQELDFLEGYLEIQCIRFQERLEVSQEVDPDVLEALVPNLILQPLVENAVKHGVSQMEAGGKIDIRAWRDGERLHVSVRDNGPGLTFTGDGEPGTDDGETGRTYGIGLRNTRERLESHYGPEQSLTLTPALEGGIVSHISLPYHTAADLFTTAFQA
jgi:sensor histidine kinase YesM